MLPRVPDVFGPGSILGWSLTVMGSELPSTMEEEREYLRCRWGGIHGLGLKHSHKAAELLEVTPLAHHVGKANFWRKFGDGRIKLKRLEDHRFLGISPWSRRPWFFVNWGTNW